MTSFFPQIALLLVFSLALTGCSLGGDKAETTVSPFASPKVSEQVVSESSSPPPMAFASGEIVETVKDLLEKGEEIPQDIEKAFLEYALEETVNTLLNMGEFASGSEIPKEETEKLENLRSLIDRLREVVPEIFTDFVLSPNSEEFFAKKEGRKVCYIAEGIPIKAKGRTPYRILKGNACDELMPSLRPIEEDYLIPKESADERRIEDIRMIKTALELYYGDGDRFKYTKNIDLLVSNNYLSKIPKDPETAKEYEIKLSSNSSNPQKYCIMTRLTEAGAKEKMENDYGDDPLLYEVGDGCKNL